MEVKYGMELSLCFLTQATWDLPPDDYIRVSGHGARPSVFWKNSPAVKAGLKPLP